MWADFSFLKKISARNAFAECCMSGNFATHLTSTEMATIVHVCAIFTSRRALDKSIHLVNMLTCLQTHYNFTPPGGQELCKSSVCPVK